MVKDKDGFGDFEEVIAETVGQYTGLYDKNGKEIYEGDINQDKGILEWNQDDASFVCIIPMLKLCRCAKKKIGVKLSATSTKIPNCLNNAHPH